MTKSTAWLCGTTLPPRAQRRTGPNPRPPGPAPAPTDPVGDEHTVGIYHPDQAEQP